MRNKRKLRGTKVNPKPPFHEADDDAVHVNTGEADDDAVWITAGQVCARYGGHKVTFTKRNGWVSWRCVYPHAR